MSRNHPNKHKFVAGIKFFLFYAWFSDNWIRNNWVFVELSSDKLVFLENFRGICIFAINNDALGGSLT